MASTRREEILAWICIQSKQNNGVPPSAREIAREYDLNQSTVMAHLAKLEREGKISWVGDKNHKRIKVERAQWEQPPDVDL